MGQPRDTLNAFVDGPFEPKASSESGSLSGLSLAVKDIYDVEGQRTGGGNPQMLAESAPAEKTAPAVQALLEAGAVLIGRTQTDELTFSLMGQNAHFPEPVNPAAPERVTGGSSSGSAAAVAGGLADIATGSDTGGSIRAPASFCGLIGLRTTHGAISLSGAMPLAPSFDTFGWFARDAEIYKRVADILLAPSSGPSGHLLPMGEKNAAEKPAPSSPHRGEGGSHREPGEGETFRLLSLAALDGLVLGAPEADEYERMAGIIASALGPIIRAPALSQSVDDLYWIFRKLQSYEAWAVHGDWISASDRNLGPGVKERFEFGSSLGCEVATAETARRTAFRDELAALLGNDGLLVMPTVPGAAPLKKTPFDELQNYRERALRLLCFSGLSGFPQITIPLGTVDGAPFGISLLGPAGSDRRLIALASGILNNAGRV